MALGALPLAHAQQPPLADGRPVLGGGGLGAPLADVPVSFASHHVDDEADDRAHAAAWSTADGGSTVAAAADHGWTPRDSEVGIGTTSSASAGAAEAEAAESTVEVRQRLQESICRQEAAHDLQQSLETDVSEKIRSEFLPGALPAPRPRPSRPAPCPSYAHARARAASLPRFRRRRRRASASPLASPRRLH